MTFEQAGMEYARISSECRAGRMAPQEFHARAAQLRVQTPDGRWWQMEPSSGQWMWWNGTAWVPHQPAPAPPPLAAAAPKRAAAAGPGIGEALISVAPGILVQFLQRGAFYKANPSAAAQFLAPCLLGPVAMALAPKLGRAFAIVVILACLGWLAWPVASTLLQGGDTKNLMADAGRGLAGISLLYMIPRVWRAAKP